MNSVRGPFGFPASPKLPPTAPRPCEACGTCAPSTHCRLTPVRKTCLDGRTSRWPKVRLTRINGLRLRGRRQTPGTTLGPFAFLREHFQPIPRRPGTGAKKFPREHVVRPIWLVRRKMCNPTARAIKSASCRPSEFTFLAQITMSILYFAFVRLPPSQTRRNASSRSASSFAPLASRTTCVSRSW